MIFLGNTISFCPSKPSRRLNAVLFIILQGNIGYYNRFGIWYTTLLKKNKNIIKYFILQRTVLRDGQQTDVLSACCIYPKSRKLLNQRLNVYSTSIMVVVIKKSIIIVTLTIF